VKKYAVILLAIFLAAAGLFSGSAGAEMKAGDITLSPQIGGYVFDSDRQIKSDPVYGIGLGYNITDRIGIEGVFNYIDGEKKNTGTDVEVLMYRLDGLYHFVLENGVYPYIAAGAGAITIDEKGIRDNTDFLFNYGAGIKFLVTERMYFRGDVRNVLTFEDNTNSDLIYTVGFDILLGKKAEPAPVPKDSDGDGVYDDADQCPGTPQGVAVDSKGCPLDSDGDGVYDYKDKCPGTPSGVVVDTDGCPRDSDGDGVYDYLDKCPGTPKGAPVDSVGCPLDSDKDGVFDYLDKCPDTPEGIAVDSTGCPLPIKKEVRMNLSVEFAFDSAEVKSVYADHITKVANFLKAYPDAWAEIEGHTDSKGTDEYNLRLSQKRAINVMKELIKHGIDPAYLTARGYGESRPIADNSTEAGRQKNRRVVAVFSTVTEE